MEWREYKNLKTNANMCPKSRAKKIKIEIIVLKTMHSTSIEKPKFKINHWCNPKFKILTE